MWVNKRKEQKMRNLRVYRFWIGLAMVISFLLTSCEEEGSLNFPEENASGFKFVMSLYGSMNLDTKATPPQLGTDDKVEVKDIWILQYGKLEGGTEGLLAFVYFTENINQAENSSGGTYDNIVTVTSENETFRYVESRFYVIVNGGADVFGNKKTTTAEGKTELSLTEDELKAITVPLTTASSVPSIVQPGLLVAGPIAYTPTATTENKVEGTTEKVIFIGSLTRAYAKVSVMVNLSENNKGAFSITNALVKNLPKSMALYTKAGGTGNYPAANDIYETEVSIGSITVGKEGTMQGTGVSFYMAENYRGKGSATSATEKNTQANGPSGDLTGCTCLILRGTYKYDSTHPNGIEVEYRFYLGDDMISDYNIQRNYHYDLTINIAGPNSADYRVKITNGNVAVFDDADNVENEVTF